MTDPAPLVSVVMATYTEDNPAHLEKAVASVLAQTCRDLELVVVLDGPVSKEIRQFLDGCIANDSRVRQIELSENKGPAAARNKGVAESRGAYVAILDADDIALPDRLEKQIAFIQETNADLIGSHYELIDEDGERLGIKRTPATPEAIRRKVWLFNPIGNSTVLARRETLVDNPYREDLRYGEDYNLWIRLLRKGCVLRNLPEPLVRFRTPPDFLRRRRGRERFRSDLANKFAALPLYNPLVRPFIAAGAFCIAATRLLPTPILALVYGAGRAATR